MPDSTNRSEQHFEAGDEFAGQGKFSDALDRYQTAWDCLPDPKEEQERAIPCLAAIADCHFALGQWDACCDALQHAFRCGAALDNIFLRLRLGQSLYELGNETEAANWLVPVYLMEGRRPFDGDDPKYLEFFRGKLNPPAGGWPEGW